MKVLDLFSGFGGWSQAFRDRGHYVVMVDNNPNFNPNICIDIMNYEPDEFFDLVLASPPCTEFTKASMPDSWNKNRTVNPDTKLVERTIKIIKMAGCKYWIIENVRGAVPYFKPLLGKPVKKIGSRYLWGDFPIVDIEAQFGKWKLSPGKDRPALRSLIPYKISYGICRMLENINNDRIYNQ